MSVDTNNIQRYMFPGNLYVGVTKPADTANMTHTLGVPTGGTHVGATTGEAVFEYRPTIATVDIEQAFGGVAPHMTAETATIRATISEPTLSNVRLAMQQGTYAAGGGYQKLMMGGLTTVSVQAVCLIGKEADRTKYVWALLYAAYASEGVARRMKKGEPATIPVTFTGLPDTSRTAGDQLAQYVEEV